jgi:preprotein translocase subunit SecE
MRADSEMADYPSSQMASRRFRDLREAPKEPPRGPAWARPFIFFEEALVEVSKVVWPSRAQTRTAVVAALLPIAAVLVISLAVVLVIAVR